MPDLICPLLHSNLTDSVSVSACVRCFGVRCFCLRRKHKKKKNNNIIIKGLEKSNRMEKNPLQDRMH